jgi:hypothetical protein
MSADERMANALLCKTANNAPTPTPPNQMAGKTRLLKKVHCEEILFIVNIGCFKDVDDQLDSSAPKNLGFWNGHPAALAIVPTGAQIPKKRMGIPGQISRTGKRVRDSFYSICSGGSLVSVVK